MRNGSKWLPEKSKTWIKPKLYEKRCPKGQSLKMRLVCVRVLARILKLPVQNNNSKISAHPEVATTLLPLLIPSTFNSLMCQKGQFTYLSCHRRWFVRKIFGYYPPKVKIENISQKILPVHKESFQENACPKDRQDGSWLSAWSA